MNTMADVKYGRGAKEHEATRTPETRVVRPEEMQPTRVRPQADPTQRASSRIVSGPSPDTFTGGQYLPSEPSQREAEAASPREDRFQNTSRRLQEFFSQPDMAIVGSEEDYLDYPRVAAVDPAAERDAVNQLKARLGQEAARRNGGS